MCQIRIMLGFVGWNLLVSVAVRVCVFFFEEGQREKQIDRMLEGRMMCMSA